MTSKIIESTIESFAIELLEKQGYQYIYGPDIAPDSDRTGASPYAPANRESFEDVLLIDKLKSAVA